MNPEKITQATNLLLLARATADEAEAARKAAEAEFVATLEAA